MCAFETPLNRTAGRAGEALLDAREPSENLVFGSTTRTDVELAIGSDERVEQVAGALSFGCC
jgi:hypothetical protein